MTTMAIQSGQPRLGLVALFFPLALLGGAEIARAADPPAAAAVGRTFSASTETNRPAEFTFESKSNYADPFNDVTVDAIFTEPSGATRQIPLFWAGGNTFRLRYASSNPGAHTFVTECSDAKNAELHGVRGSVSITRYKGKNPLFVHGAIKVADDRRHFAHADGTPFFWLGDTWWMALSRLSLPEFAQLADLRRDQGFTVIQLVAGLYPDMPAFDERGKGEMGFAWEKDWSRVRPEFFDAADKRITYLTEQGLVPSVFASWGYYLSFMGAEKMKQHWRYLIARWGALPVTWTSSGEQDLHWYLSGDKENERRKLKREWTDVIRYIRQIDGFHRLVTTHPLSQARDTNIDPFVLDFDMQQSGHGVPPEKHALKALEGWNRTPTMPVISGESRYEALEIKPPLTTRDARQAFWAHLLNSGVAGHTFGVNGIWQVNRADAAFGKSPSGNNWGTTPWDVAMKMPGASQLGAAKRFLLTLPWHRLMVATDLARVADKAEGFWSVSATEDRTWALVSLVSQSKVTIELGRFPGPVTPRWFDPASGKTLPAGAALPNKGSRELSPPGRNAAGDEDWVLLLSASRPAGSAKK